MNISEIFKAIFYLILIVSLILSIRYVILYGLKSFIHGVWLGFQ